MKKLILVAVLLAMLFAASCAWGDGGHSNGSVCYYFGDCDNL